MRDFKAKMTLQSTLLSIIICISLIGMAHAETGTASWYSKQSCIKEGTWQKYGGKCADGKYHNLSKELCVASWFYPFNTRLVVTCLRTGKKCVVTVTDRGPNRKLVKRGRIIDLSKMAFMSIANLKEGVIKVSIKKYD